MVDVVFLLLLYFMLVSHYHTLHRIPLQATESASGAPSDTALLITIQDDGAIQLNQQPMAFTALIQHLRTLQNPSALAVGIHPAATVPLQRLVQVMDAVRAVGIQQIHLIQE